MKPAEAARQAAALASVLEHPGYKVIDEWISKRIERTKATLATAKFTDMREVGSLQGEIKALTELRGHIASTIKNAPKEADE